jgi:hypothetical protein
MQLKYKFYFGGDHNPFQKEVDAAYEKITEERETIDPNKERPIEEVFPLLDSWPDYLIANSKSVFWLMERAICRDESQKAGEIEEFWEEARRNGNVGEWLMKSEADESTKAMCYYMASLHRAFDPIGNAVDFRFYVSEGRQPSTSHDGEGFSLEPYE